MSSFDLGGEARRARASSTDGNEGALRRHGGDRDGSTLTSEDEGAAVMSSVLHESGAAGVYGSDDEEEMPLRRDDCRGAMGAANAAARRRADREGKRSAADAFAASYDEELLAPGGAAAAATEYHGLIRRGDGDDVGGSETGVVDDEGDVVMQPARANEVADKRPREEDGDGHDDVGGSSAGARAQTAGDTRSGHSGTGQKRSRGAKKTGNQKKNVREGYKRAGRDAARGER